MIIDCHTHLGRNSHINASADRLLKSMDKAKIDKSIVIAGKLNDASNEWMLEQIAPYKDRLLAIVAAHPSAYDYPNSGAGRDTALAIEQDEIKKITDWYGEGKIVGVKFYTGYYHFYPSDASNYLRHLDVIGCPTLFHSGDCLNSVKQAKLKYAHPLHIDDVAVDYPHMNFIIAHMAYPWVRDAAEVCYKNDNVYSDISGFVYGDFSSDDVNKFSRNLKDFLDIADGTKMLFGTDWPISNQDSYIDSLKTISEHTADLRISNVLNPQYMIQNIIKAFRLNVKT